MMFVYPVRGMKSPYRSVCCPPLRFFPVKTCGKGRVKALPIRINATMKNP